EPGGTDQPRVVATIPVGHGPDGITTDGNKVFVSHAREGTLLELDAKTNRPVGDPVKVGSNPDQIAAGKGTVWVVDAAGGRPPRPSNDPHTLPAQTLTL